MATEQAVEKSKRMCATERNWWLSWGQECELWTRRKAFRYWIRRRWANNNGWVFCALPFSRVPNRNLIKRRARHHVYAWPSLFTKFFSIFHIHNLSVFVVVGPNGIPAACKCKRSLRSNNSNTKLCRCVQMASARGIVIDFVLQKLQCLFLQFFEAT